MKEKIFCLREYVKLKEGEQASYLRNHGNHLVTSASVFTGIPNDGTAILADSVILFNTYSDRNLSVAKMKEYTDQKSACEGKMEVNYDFVDLTANGDGDIVALAGINGSSTNTSATTVPGKPNSLEFIFGAIASEIGLSRDVDKLAYGSLMVTFIDKKIIVERSADDQMKITTADGTIILVNVATGSKTIIKNVIKGTELNSVVALFNPNGLSALASPESVVVPR
jgi:hypothetical protein